VDGDRNIIAKGVVVEDVDAEEKNDIDTPAFDGDFVRADEERRTVAVELGDVAGDGDEEKLGKRKEGTL
jgi:hypothetical protein